MAMLEQAASRFSGIRPRVAVVEMVTRSSITHPIPSCHVNCSGSGVVDLYPLLGADLDSERVRQEFIDVDLRTDGRRNEPQDSGSKYSKGHAAARRLACMADSPKGGTPR